MDADTLYLTADFLYWRSENHGFSYAYVLTNTSGLNIGNIVRVNPKWQPGFRVGLGWNTSYDFWDVFANYTWYQNNSTKKSSNTLGFFPLWPASSSTTGSFEAVSARSRFVMNMGDLEVGRMMYLTKSVVMRPYWGVRGGTLHQKFSNHFTVPTPGKVINAQVFSGRNNYWGVGPRTGVNAEWRLSHGFGLLGKMAGALLYGKNRVQFLNQTLPAGLTSFTVERQYTDNYYQLVPNFQLSMGFQWQTCFWCEKMFFKMSAAWETNFWWDQFNLPYALSTFNAPLPTASNQARTMEGLTVNFEFDF